MSFQEAWNSQFSRLFESINIGIKRMFIPEKNRLDLPSNASTPDIYRAAMEANIRHSLVPIPNDDLKKLHQRLVMDLSVSSREEMHEISRLFDAANNLNNSCGQERDLTFKTRHERQGRYCGFNKNPQSWERVTVDGYDQTSSELSEAIGAFGNHAVCRKVSGTWNQLARNAGASSVSFESLIEKGILTNRNVKVSSYAEHPVLPLGEYIYAYPALASLYFHAPDFVKNRSVSFRIEKEMCCYGNDKIIHLSFIKLENTSQFSAKARAEYEFSVKKGFAVPTWLKVSTFGLGSILDAEKTMHFSSSQFNIKFECGPNWFKVKKPLEINIRKEAARNFLQMEMRLRQYREQLEMRNEMKMLENAEHEVIEEMKEDQLKQVIEEALENGKENIKNALEKETSPDNKDTENRTWLLDIIVNGVEKNFVIKIVPSSESSLQELVLEIATRDEAFRHIDSGLMKTVLQKYYIVLESPSGIPGLPINSKNDLCGFAFEEMVNARVLAKAAENGIPLKIIEGDGLGQFTDAAGNLVKTPEYVDAVFLNEASGETISVQYKFSDQEWKLEALKQQWEKTWQGKDLNTIDVVVPKGVTQDPNFKEHVKLSDKIQVDTPTHQEVADWLDSKSKKLIEMSKEIKQNKPVKQLHKNLQKNIKKLQNDIDSMNAKMQTTDEKTRNGMSKGIKNLEKKRMEFEDKLVEVQKKLEESTNRLDQILAEDGPNAIPGGGDEIAEQARARAELAKNVKKLEKIRQAQKELKTCIGMAAVISSSTELIISLVDETRLCRAGKQSLKQAVWNICKRTAKATALGTGIAAGMGGVQYGLTRMALAESSKLAAFGNIGSKIFGPAMLAAGLAYQSYGILKQYDMDKDLSPEFAQKRMLTNFTRMAGVTAGSVGSFVLASAYIASGPVGMTVGAIVTVALLVGDHFLGEWLGHDKEAMKLEYERLKERVLDEAYALFDLERNCSDRELKKAYFAALRKYHPDKREEEDEENEIIRAVIAAYTVIKTVREHNI